MESTIEDQKNESDVAAVTQHEDVFSRELLDDYYDLTYRT